jgi:hypothetical protein
MRTGTPLGKGRWMAVDMVSYGAGARMRRAAAAALGAGSSGGGAGRRAAAAEPGGGQHRRRQEAGSGSGLCLETLAQGVFFGLALTALRQVRETRRNLHGITHGEWGLADALIAQIG